MERPDGAAVREALPQVDWADKGYPAPVPPATADPLDAVVEIANAYVENVTWRDLDSTMPARLAPTALQAVALATAQLVVQGDDDYVATINDDALQSMSVGPYSETRRDQTRRGEQRALNSWPQLDTALWLLLSLAPGEVNAQVDERREYWLFMVRGQNQPAWALAEVDWTGSRGGGWPTLPPPVLDLPDVAGSV